MNGATRAKTLPQKMADNWQLYALLIIPVVLTLVYKYVPMYASNRLPRLQGKPGLLGQRVRGLQVV